MKAKGLTLIVALLLLGGIVLLIFGFSMAPTVREAVGNGLERKHTGKRNIQKCGGFATAAAGEAGRHQASWLAGFHSQTT